MLLSARALLALFAYLQYFASMQTRTTPLIYETRAEFLKALAHPGRLHLVDLLKDGEHCVCELAAATGYDISTVSRHLAQMKRAGIVSDRRQGTSAYFTLNLCCIADLFTCMEKSLHKRQQSISAALAACAPETESQA